MDPIEKSLDPSDYDSTFREEDAAPEEPLFARPVGHGFWDECREVWRECGDEGELCEACLEERAEEMGAHFGIRPGMTRQERRAALERMRPEGAEGRTGAEVDRE